jgi:hypothetical protein
VALSADGDTALVGGWSDAGGVGAAWVFTRSGSSWRQGPKLTAGDETGAGNFGIRVALSADANTALIVGSADDGGIGAAWAFTRSGSTWTQQGSKLTPGDATRGFGTSEALSADGDTALIGGSSADAGAVWVFARSSSGWSQQGPELTTADGGSGFGRAVALSASGDTALVGSGTDGGGVGAAWAFVRSGTSWTQQGSKLTAYDESGAAHFGGRVALSADGSTALVGGWNDNAGVGAAWAFTRSGSSWLQEGPKLTAAGETGAGSFGVRVALSGDGNTALASGSDDSGGIGAAWVFTRTASRWSQQVSKLIASDEGGAASFGGSVALSADGNTALIGGAADNRNTGAAWVFVSQPPARAQPAK